MLFGPLGRLIRASESYFPLFSLNGKLPGTIAPPLLVEQQLPSLPRLDELLCLSPERPPHGRKFPITIFVIFVYEFPLRGILNKKFILALDYKSFFLLLSKSFFLVDV
jgi:hypothetical protein